MVGERVSSEIQYMVGERARDSKHEFVDEILNESARQMGFGHRAELRLDSIQNTSSLVGERSFNFRMETSRNESARRFNISIERVPELGDSIHQIQHQYRACSVRWLSS